MIIDLTHLLNEDITVYPGTISPTFAIGNTIEKDGFAELNIQMCTHTGTHIDAPAHILEGTKTLDQFPIEKFVGKAFVVDCTEQKEIDKAFLSTYEKEIREAEFLLFYTGWQHKWKTENYFDVFPTLTIEAANWLTHFSLKALGFDAISVDKMDVHELPNHHILLGKEILIIENMTNLDQLIGKKLELNCIPLKIENADGSPVRAFARIK